ncbi:hydantoinase B/oxoprolinase family protein [Streptomyces acidicola]|uniref:hydantoinase B/oxoprolinase family protein n=1 Tax=Streptomyces acidicola TaxID=2596892 RepID=UPI00382E367C
MSYDPGGVFSEVRYVDEKLPGDRGTYRVQVNLHKAGDRIVIDNEGTTEQGEGPIGIVFNGFSGSVFGVLGTSMLYEQLFAFGGAGRQIEYAPTPGLITCVDHPAACSAGILNVVTHMGAVQTCINRMLATDPELKQDIVAASPDYPVPVIAGKDDRGGTYGQAVLDHMAMGSGARAFGDGINTGGPSWSPLIFLLNAESIEQWYPMVYLYRTELTDSGGAGRWRGGVGLKYAWTLYRAESMNMVTFSGGMRAST